MSPIMLKVIISLKENAYLWTKMDLVLAYRTAREEISTRTKEKVYKDEETDRVVEAQ